MIVLEEAHLNEVLLPCPLADAGKAVFTENQFFFGTGYGVKCDHCGLWLDSRSRTKAVAARLWNARRRLTELAQQEDRHDVAAPVATVAPVEQSEPAHDYAVTASIQCANCGGGIADSWAYCHRCGANRETITAPASPAALRDEARPYDQGFADMRERAIQIAESYCEDIPQHVDIESDKNTFAAGYLVAAGGIRQALTRIPFATTPPSTLAKAAEEIWKRIDSENHLTLPNRFEIQAIIERHFAPLAADNDAE